MFFQKIQILLLITVPTPIKDVASIQESFFKNYKKVHFAEFRSILLHVIAQNSVKQTYFRQIFMRDYYSKAYFIRAATVNIFIWTFLSIAYGTMFLL